MRNGSIVERRQSGTAATLGVYIVRSLDLLPVKLGLPQAIIGDFNPYCTTRFDSISDLLLNMIHTWF